MSHESPIFFFTDLPQLQDALELRDARAEDVLRLVDGLAHLRAERFSV